MNIYSLVTFKDFFNRIDSEVRLDPTSNAINIARANIELALHTRKGTAKTTVTAIEFFEEDVPLIAYCSEPKKVTAETLKDAAKVVYDFCKKGGLKPAVVWKHSSDQNHCIRITVQLPVGKVVKKIQMPKRKVKFRKKAELGSL